MSIPRPISAISSPRRYRPYPASPTRAPSSPSRRSGQNDGGGAAKRSRGRALLARGGELALAPDHEQPGRGNDRGADHDHHGRRLAEHRIAEQQRPDHRRIVERRDYRGRRVAIAFGQEDMTGAAED